MIELIRRHPVAFGLALLMHLVLVALMVFGLDWLHPPKPVVPKAPVVQATLVDQKKLEAREAAKKAAELERRRRLEEEKRRKAELERKKKLEAERKRKAELERKKKLEAERKRKAELERKKKLEAERKRKAELERKKRLEAERKRKAELERKKKLEAERKRKAELERKKRLEAERKRKAELERKKRLEAERKRKAELERKKRLEAERKRKAEAARRAREAELAAQLEAERAQREMATVMAAIRRKVQNNWLRPAGSRGRGLQAKVRVRLNDKGSVLLVKIVQSSGDPLFDESVVRAVYRAEPLPMPSSPRLMDQFRNFTFVFKPGQ